MLVGTAGFELATPCTPCKCATRLRYTPKQAIVAGLSAFQQQCADFFELGSKLAVREW